MLGAGEGEMWVVKGGGNLSTVMALGIPGGLEHEKWSEGCTKP